MRFDSVTLQALFMIIVPWVSLADGLSGSGGPGNLQGRARFVRHSRQENRRRCEDGFSAASLFQEARRQVVRPHRKIHIRAGGTDQVPPLSSLATWCNPGMRGRSRGPNTVEIGRSWWRE